MTATARSLCGRMLAALLLAAATMPVFGDAWIWRRPDPLPGAAYGVFVEPASLEAFLRGLPLAAAEAVRARLPEGDGAVVVAFLGTAPSGGYAVRVADVRTAAGRLEIAVLRRSPAPDELVTQALTYPVDVATVPADRLPPPPFEAVFRTPEGEVLARKRVAASASPEPAGGKALPVPAAPVGGSDAAQR